MTVLRGSHVLSTHSPIFFIRLSASLFLFILRQIFLRSGMISSNSRLLSTSWEVAEQRGCCPLNSSGTRLRAGFRVLSWASRRGQGCSRHVLPQAGAWAGQWGGLDLDQVVWDWELCGFPKSGLHRALVFANYASLLKTSVISKSNI